MRTGLTPAEALTIIVDETPVLGVETTAVIDAQDRVLAEAIVSNRQIPPADNSAMDGFAVRSEDVASASRDQPVVLEVVYEWSAERGVEEGDVLSFTY